MGVGAGLYMYDVVVEKFTFAISSPDEFLVPFLIVSVFGSVRQIKLAFHRLYNERKYLVSYPIVSY